MTDFVSLNSSAPVSDCDVIVVGGGPAGLMAAIVAARRERRVVMLDRNEMPGGKLPVTGGGHCNLSFMASADIYYDRFGPQGRFMSDALRDFMPEDLVAFMAELGLECCVDSDSRVFPSTRRARDVVGVLVEAAKQAGVNIVSSTRVCEVLTGGGGARSDKDSSKFERIEGVRCDNGSSYRGAAVVLACGGMTYSGFGATKDGYAMSTALGYEIVKPRCALAGLHLRGRRLESYSGLTLGDAEISIARSRRRVFSARGGLVVTHEGLSGPAALDISTYVSAAIQRGGPWPVINLNLRPDIDISQWRSEIQSWRSSHGSRKLVKLLAESLGRAIAQLVMDLAGLPEDMQTAQAPADIVDRLTVSLAAAPLEVVGVDGPKKAMVTAGGISLRQVDPRTMAGRLTEGLYFAGELLDLDGPTGGFNLQWAFSSGHLAGRFA